MNFSPFQLGLIFAAVVAVATAAAGLAQNTAPLAPGAAPPVPTASPSAGPQRGRRAPARPGASPSPGATETPEPPQFATLDGVWEVELQPIGKRLATYSHFDISSTGENLAGFWLSGPKNAKYPLTGSFDGRLISINVAMPDGTTTTFSGYVETFADMVGLMRTKETDPGVAFTAQHRKKLKV